MYRQIYGEGFIHTDYEAEVDGKTEPASDNPLIPALWKMSEAAAVYAKDPEVAEQFMILATDVVFMNPRREASHKPSRDGIDQETLLADTQAWYAADTFVVQWLVSHVVHEHVSGGTNRSIGYQFVIEGTFPALPAETVVANVNPEMNTRLPLIDLALEAGVAAQFVLTTPALEGQAGERLNISAAEAFRLVVDKIIPPAVLANIISQEVKQPHIALSLLTADMR